jgi:hypothetical protein
MSDEEFRDLDAKVHREVMGLYCERGFVGSQPDWVGYCEYGMHGIPHYSTRIDSAWKVVEKLQKDGCSVKLSNKIMDWCWWCYVLRPEESHPTVSQAPTAAEAICLAALLVDDREREAGPPQPQSK